MTTEQRMAMLRMDAMYEDGDRTLAQLAREAITAGDVELQMAVIGTPLMGMATLRVFMEMSEYLTNAVYANRLQVAADPTRGDCILAMLAELAVEFADVEMINAIRQNPSAGEKTKKILAA